MIKPGDRNIGLSFSDYPSFQWEKNGNIPPEWPAFQMGERCGNDFLMLEITCRKIDLPWLN